MAVERSEPHPQTIAFNEFLITLDGTGDTLHIEARHNNEVVIFEYSPEHIVFDRQILPDPQTGHAPRSIGTHRSKDTGFEQTTFDADVHPEENTVEIHGSVVEPPLFTRAKKGQGKAPASFIVAENDLQHEIHVPTRLVQATKNLKLAKGDRVEVAGQRNAYKLQLQNGEEKEHVRINLSSMKVVERGVFAERKPFAPQ